MLNVECSMFPLHKLKIHFAISHKILRESNTGPSVQVRWYSQPSPVLMGITHVRQTPTPQHMCSSIESSACTLDFSAISPTAFNIPVGPQANNLRRAVLRFNSACSGFVTSPFLPWLPSSVVTRTSQIGRASCRERG